MASSGMCSSKSVSSWIRQPNKSLQLTRSACRRVAVFRPRRQPPTMRCSSTPLLNPQTKKDGPMRAATLLLAALVLLFGNVRQVKADFIINGGFEQPGGRTSDVDFMAGNTSIVGWAIVAGSVDIVPTYGGHWPAYQGQQSSIFDGESAGTTRRPSQRRPVSPISCHLLTAITPVAARRPRATTLGTPYGQPTSVSWTRVGLRCSVKTSATRVQPLRT